LSLAIYGSSEHASAKWSWHLQNGAFRCMDALILCWKLMIYYNTTLMLSLTWHLHDTSFWMIYVHIELLWMMHISKQTPMLSTKFLYLQIKHVPCNYWTCKIAQYSWNIVAWRTYHQWSNICSILIMMVTCGKSMTKRVSRMLSSQGKLYFLPNVVSISCFVSTILRGTM
jgi:hypothetical protein